MTNNDRPAGSTRPPGQFLSRAERARRTQELLDAAAAASTGAERRRMLAQVAALNLDVVTALATAMARRYPRTPIDREALLRHVRSVYTDGVLALESPPERDFVIWVVPLVRAAVVDFMRVVPALS